tara:strand:+ start:2515 stop:3009 length:495 start_codon:yes stop_codon:yes gene_type:complete
MKKFYFIFLLLSVACFSQKLKTKKIFNIKVSVGDYSQPGEYLNLQTSYAPYSRGEFNGITSGKVLPIGGDFFKSYSKDGTNFSELDIDLVMLTDGGEKILCKASGILNYEIETFKPIKFETQWRFMTSSKEFSYLNEVIAIGLGSFLDDKSGYMFQHEIYQVYE